MKKKIDDEISIYLGFRRIQISFNQFSILEFSYLNVISPFGLIGLLMKTF